MATASAVLGGHRLLWAALFGIVFFVLLDVNPAAAGVGRSEIAAYKQQFDVPVAVAEAGLDTQHRGDEIVTELEDRLGSRYGGVWFDGKAGEFVVPLPPGASSIAVAAELSAEQLAGDYRTVSVQSTWEELEAAQEALNGKLTDLIEAGLVITGLDPRTNAIVIQRSVEANKAERNRIERLAQAQSVDVEIRELKASQFDFEPTACDVQNHACGLPLRGGIKIRATEFGGIYQCSSAFRAQGDANGRRYLLTAGHCHNPELPEWTARDNILEDHYLGPVSQVEFSKAGDWAKIDVTGSWWDKQPWPAEVAYWGGNEDYPINGEASSYLFQTVCHSGFNTGTHCGTVTGLDQTIDYGPSGIVEHLTRAWPMCVGPGDSGGSVFASNQALGILSGASVDPECEREMVYSEITRATKALGVHVNPAIVGTAPNAQTLDAIGFPPPNKVTVSGSVDPNGDPTTYRFEYGTTTSYSNSTPSWSAGTQWDPSTVTGTITGLQPLTTYHFRILAQNSRGTSVGQDRTFTTPNWAPIPGEDDNFPGPRVIAQANGTIDVFYRMPSGALGHNWFDTGGAGWLSGNLPGTLASSAMPHAVVQPNGTIDVFYRTPSNQLGHNWFDVGGSGWHSGNLPAIITGEPHPIVQPNGTVDVFFRSVGNMLGHAWFDVGGAGWQVGPLPGTLASEPHPVVQPNGTIDVFYRTPSNGLGHNWFDVGGSGWQSGNLPGTLASDPHPVVLANGTVDVFYRTPSNGLGHNWFDTGGAGWLSGNLPGTLASDPHPILQQNGTIDVFYRTPGGQLGHNWFAPCCGGWSAGNLPGSLVSDPYPIVQQNGTVDVFYRSASGALGHSWFDTGSGWFAGDLPGSPASPPHAIAQQNGTVDVFYRTTVGALGHNWFDTGGAGWLSGNLPGTIAARLPQAATLAASGVGTQTATLNGSVNPEASETSYYFEYGTTTSYGSKKPAAAAGVGSQEESVAVSQALTGLAEGTTYNYRVVAASPEGTTYGANKTFTTQSPSVSTQLASMLVTDPFNATTSAVSNFATDWSKLGWAGSLAPKGENKSNGWGPADGHPNVNGAYYSRAIANTGPGIAVSATVSQNPGFFEGRYFSVWLDMPSPGSAQRAGYELKFTHVANNTYNVALSKWVGGSQTPLGSKTSYSLPLGSSFALVDQGANVSAWTNTGSGFSQLLSAGDSAFESGYAGVEGAGNVTRLTKFKVGALLNAAANMNAALGALSLNDAFATNESPLSGGGKWAALSWDNSTTGYNTGWVSGGWSPWDSFPTINGAYWKKAAFADTGAGDAVVATLSNSPGITTRYFSLWLNMPNPASVRTGYELRFTETGLSAYEVALSKWEAGTKSLLASKTGYSFPLNSKFALVEKAGTVSVWTKTGSEFTQLLSVANTALTSGYTGVEGSGSNTRLKDFRSGHLPPF